MWECYGHDTREECERHEGYCDGHESAEWCDCPTALLEP